MRSAQSFSEKIQNFFHRRSLRLNFEKIIKNDSFCALPWVHAHFYPDGRVYPCCIGALHKMGDLKKNTFTEVWNSLRFRHLRKSMLLGRKSIICKNCHIDEKHSGRSWRLDMNKSFASSLPKILETTLDGTVENQKMAYLDVRFSNMCNLKCRTCDPNHSHLWNADMPESYGGGKPKLISLSGLPNYPQKTLDDSIDTLEEIYFAGGEPLITKEHYELLNKMIQAGRTNVRLRYSTNLTVLKFGAYDIFDLWKHFKSVLLVASVDAVDEKTPFVRHGSDWSKIKENFAIVKQRAPHVSTSVSPTISILNIEHITHLVETLIQSSMIRQDGLFMNILHSPRYFSIQALPKHLKEKVDLQISAYVQDLAARDARLFKQAIENLQKVQKHMNAQDTQEFLPELAKKMFELDQKRNENSLEHLPWLADVATLD